VQSRNVSEQKSPSHWPSGTAVGRVRDTKRNDTVAVESSPSVLLTATLHWPIAARLAIAFRELGCRVETVCPREHFVTRTRALSRAYPYSALSPMRSLRTAIRSAAPDIVIPCDDRAAVHLAELHSRANAKASRDPALAQLLARSLGVPAACALSTERGHLLTIAREEGVRTPTTRVVRTIRELDDWLGQNGFPAVLKIDSTWGGQGVAVVRTRAEARRVWSRMATSTPLTALATRFLLDRDAFQLIQSLKRTRRTVTVQAFVCGAPANRAVACSRGSVRAGISVVAVETQHLTGPATVVRVIEHSEMAGVVDRMVSRLGVSGLWGFDFVLEESTGAAYLIEVNPRATPICHLPLSGGRDLVRAVCELLAGARPVTRVPTLEQTVVALFPGEWLRNPASVYLTSHYHDVPPGELRLCLDLLDRPWSDRGWVARLWAAVRSRRPRLQSGRGQADAVKRDGCMDKVLTFEKAD
jgi:hypothetical protein